MSHTELTEDTEFFNTMCLFIKNPQNGCPCCLFGIPKMSKRRNNPKNLYYMVSVGDYKVKGL